MPSSTGAASAEGAIAVGRPPASSRVLGGMVHGAMYDAVAAIERGLTPFATSVTAPPDASAEAAVAQAAKDGLVTRVPLQAAAGRVASDDYRALIPKGTKHVSIAISSTVIGRTRISQCLDRIVADHAACR